VQNYFGAGATVGEDGVTIHVQDISKEEEEAIIEGEGEKNIFFAVQKLLISVKHLFSINQNRLIKIAC